MAKIISNSDLTGFPSWMKGNIRSAEGNVTNRLNALGGVGKMLDKQRKAYEKRCADVLMAKIGERDECENNLAYFLKKSWPSMERNEFCPGFHLDAVCLPYNSEIITSDGIKKIGDIVEDHWYGNVLSYNHILGKTEWKPIKNRMKSDGKSLIHINESLTATANHPIFIKGKGYVRADEINYGDIIFQVRELRGNKIPVLKSIKKILFSEMLSRSAFQPSAKKEYPVLQAMWEGFLQMPLSTNRGVLQYEMLGRQQDTPNRNVYGLRWQEIMGWCPVSKMLGKISETNAAIAMYSLWKGCSKKSSPIQLHQKNYRSILQPQMFRTFLQRKEESIVYRWFESARLSFRFYESEKDYSGKRYPFLFPLQEIWKTRCSSYRQKERKQQSVELGGAVPSLSPSPANGWGRKCFEIVECNVESIEPMLRIPGAVYNIEVGDNNNYFANSVLVHNCEHLEAVSNGEITRLLINIPPRTGKPIHVDELVYTKRGFIRLGDIVIGDMVLTHKGRFKKVLEVHEQGIIPTILINTNCGRSVRAAPDHPFLTPRGWVNAGDLIPKKDYVGFPRRIEDVEWGISPEEARLLGYLVGDGGISNRSLRFTNMDEDILEDFIHCAKHCGFYAYIWEGGNKALKAKNVILKSTEGRWAPKSEPPVLTWLKYHGLYESNSYTKRIPPRVLASNSKIIENFIGAYWSCDGTISIRHTSLRDTMHCSATTVSKGLSEDILRALSILNIHCRIRTKDIDLESKKQPGGKYRSYNIVTTERNEVAKFIGMAGLCKRKSNIASGAFFDRFEPTVYVDEVVSIAGADDGECRCLTVEEDESFTVNNLAVHNTNAVSIAWPAWTWAQQQITDLTGPQTQFLCASYGHSLALDISTKCRRLLESDWYQNFWGDRFELMSDQNTKSRFDTSAGGTRIATSVGGALTGLGANVLILDDIHNAQEMESQLVIRSAVQWFSEGLQSRLNNPKTGAIVVIMQRLSDEDLSGYILSKESGYTHLNLPIEYDSTRHCTTSIGWTDPRIEDGELLCPARIGADEVEKLKKDLGSYAFSGQYMQSPSPRGGGIIKDKWWKLYPEIGELMDEETGKPIKPLEYPAMEFIIAFVDTAYTTKEENDPSAMIILGVFRKDNAPKVMLMAAWEERLELHALVNKINKTCSPSTGIPVDRLIIENKASGKSVAQELVRLFDGSHFGVELSEPRGDKVARMYRIQHLFENGIVYAPDRVWAQMVIDQVSKFPKGSHDDLCDCLSGGLAYLRDSNFALRTDEFDTEEMEKDMYRRPQLPLYDV